MFRKKPKQLPQRPRLGQQGRRLAEDPQTPARTLAELARECQDDPYVLSLIARNPNTSGQTLTELAASSYYEVRDAVAKNPRTPATVLDRLVRDRVERFQDDSWRHTSTSTLVAFINREVAKNPNTSPGTLRLLEDHHEEVGGNPNAAPDSLTRIAEYAFRPIKKGDENYYAEWESQSRAMRALAGNPSTPRKVLKALAKTGAVDLVAGNPNASPALLLKIATGPCDWGGDEEEDDKPHRALATNPSTSLEAINILVEAHPRDADFYASRGERQLQ